MKPICIIINGKRHPLNDPKIVGRKLKQLAGIKPADTLFLNVPGDDDAVVHNDVTICVKPGSCFYSCPPARYGDHAAEPTTATGHDGQVIVHDQPGGWRFLELHGYRLPKAYAPSVVRLCVKLPPRFPDAQPDMFWVHPMVKLANGGAPQSTSVENLLGEAWMRFSWHLEPGAWRPGTSTLADFLACVRARFHRAN